MSDFKWTDELACEFYRFMIYDHQELSDKSHLQRFKESKTKKVALYTSEDGKDIYIGDETWAVTDKFDMFYIYWNEYPRYCKETKYFHSKSKAEEYILMNKPCLSLEDLLSVWSVDDVFPKNPHYYISAPMFQNFKELAKSKLK